MLNNFKNLFMQTCRLAEQESLEYMSNKKENNTVIVTCVTVAFSAVMVRYLGNFSYILSFLDSLGLHDVHQSLIRLLGNSELKNIYRLVWWAGAILIFYFLVPVFIIKFIWKDSLSNYGFRLKGAFEDYWLFILTMAIVVPLILLLSTTKSFLAIYPFYKPPQNEPLFPLFFLWECLYFLQFIALEFLFRGFMLHGTKKRFGFYSVFVMTIPYCLIHFDKPLPEVLAAIIAGIILGTLSLKCRSILMGVAMHYSVGITMDLCALWHIR
jgi:uncharacterized protein